MPCHHYGNRESYERESTHLGPTEARPSCARLPLLVTDGSILTINPLLYANLAYKEADPARRPAGAGAHVSGDEPKLPAKSLQEART
jgi:hypothetical protein